VKVDDGRGVGLEEVLEVSFELEPEREETLGSGEIGRVWR